MMLEGLTRWSPAWGRAWGVTSPSAWQMARTSPWWPERSATCRGRRGRGRALGRRAVPVYGNIARRRRLRQIVIEVRAFGDQLDIPVNWRSTAARRALRGCRDLDKVAAADQAITIPGHLRLTQAMLPQLKAAGDQGRRPHRHGQHHVGPGPPEGRRCRRVQGRALARCPAPPGSSVGTGSGQLVHPGSYIWGDSVKIYLEWQAQERRQTPWETVHEELRRRRLSGTCPTAPEIAGAVVFYAAAGLLRHRGPLPVNGGHWMPPSA